jgi:hypothetical protein
MKLKNLSIASALAMIVLAPTMAQATVGLPSPPTYGAYVEAFAGRVAEIEQQVFQDGVLPTGAYSGQLGVISASGSGEGITASADLATGALSITTSSAPGFNTEAIALFFTQVTFHGSGTGTISAGGTLVESGRGGHAEEYVAVGSLPSLPEAGFSIPNAGAWSTSSNFNFFDGETLYVIAQLSGGAGTGGSMTVTDPFSISTPDGTSFTAAAPQFLAAPEPAQWALMLVGLGGVGALMRSRRKGALASA